MRTAWPILMLPLLIAAAPPSIGYTARRLNLAADVLPSCMTTQPNGTIVIGSMDGDILQLRDTNSDGIPDSLHRWAGTLPHWPLGMMAEGDDLLVSTKSALLRLSDRDHDGWAERWRTVSDAWDVTKDHHDWTTGIVPWPKGGWIVAPATDDVRSKDVQGRHYLRGKAVHIAADGREEIIADGLRYVTGWAARPADGAIFFTDNQGQQKTSCEINRLVPGGWYGYPSKADVASTREQSYVTPTIRIPYPWARSVNGMTFVNAGGKFGPIDGQIILCEYNNKFLLRASLDEVNGTTQGAVYPFLDGLLGPVCLTFAPDGSLYVGNMRESAWGSEPEQGAIYRVAYDGKRPFGIREVKAIPGGFRIDFFDSIKARNDVAEAKTYRVRRFHHVFSGTYYSSVKDEETLTVQTVERGSDGTSVTIALAQPLIADRIYEIRVNLPDARPDMSFYTMTVVPTAKKAN